MLASIAEREQTRTFSAAKLRISEQKNKYYSNYSISFQEITLTESPRGRGCLRSMYLDDGQNVSVITRAKVRNFFDLYG